MATQERAVTGHDPQPDPDLIQPNDCLFELCLFLIEQAHFLPVHDLRGREQWFEEAAFLLAHVPSIAQRWIWARRLAAAINLCGLPVELVINELLRPREADE